MPRAGRVDRIDVDRALQLARDLGNLRNQSDFVACVSRIRQEFGGYDGYAKNLRLLYQQALQGDNTRLGVDIMKLVFQMERASADMQGGTDALLHASRLLSDEELDKAIGEETVRVLEKQGVLDLPQQNITGNSIADQPIQVEPL